MDTAQSQPTSTVWEQIEGLAQAERHFNDLQTRYRSIASTWLLAGFAGMGFALTKDEMRIPFEPVVLGIGLAVAVGVILLWVIDEIVLRNLLSAHFIEGLRMEMTDRDLPQVRHVMLRLFQGFPVRRYVAIFYGGAALAPLVAGTSIATPWLLRPGQLPLKCAFLVALVAVLSALVRMLFHGRNPTYKKLMTRLRKTGHALRRT